MKMDTDHFDTAPDCVGHSPVQRHIPQPRGVNVWLGAPPSVGLRGEKIFFALKE